MAKIGLVTVLYNSDDVLEGFFKSLSRQSFKDYVLYLVDNSVNSKTNNLINQYSTEFPVSQVKHIKSQGNIGVAAGNNVGIKNALEDNCSHIVLLNNDIEFEQEYLFEKLVSECSEKGESILVPKILYYDTRRLWMAGGYMDEWRALGVHYGYDKADAPKFNVPKYITYAPTCFMIFRKDVFEKVGLIDEKYFAYYDDTDFILRAIRYGYKLFYDPSLIVLHKVSSSVGTNSPFYVYYSNRNKLYFIRKNLKGIKRYFSILYLLISRVFFYIKFDKVKRKNLLKGIKDGFRLK